VTEDTPAMDLIQRPGTRVLAVAERPVSSLLDIAAAIDAATASAFAAGTVPETFDLPVRLELPLPEQPDGSRPVETRVWTLTRAQVESVRDLGWTLPRGEAYAQLFVAESVIDKAEGPIAAVGRGVAKSRQVMNQTYLTFLRLFQGTVKVEHLKGPVGIAHLGTKIADQGFIWVLFFLGLVSVNLAVINFLPLPIVDGGQFLMLAYEGLRGRPMPIVVQNAVTLAGLVLVGSMFLIVTFHDIKAIFGV
jgi:regulator of sigma E protease